MAPLDSQQNKNSDFQPVASQWEEFSISRFKLVRRALACLLAVVFCLSLFMSTLNRYMQKHLPIELNHMTLIYLLLLFFIILGTLGAVFSVRKVRISAENIEISTLFWQESLNWSDLLLVHAPPNLKFAWIRTKRCFYLLIKPEFKNYATLERLLAQKVQINTAD